MGLKEDKTITDIVQAVKESDAKKTKGYDTTATVTRIEDGKAWVHIPGGVTETPAELTINAKPGDNVMVRVAGGRAFLLGNATNPPTDDATAKEALSNAADALQSAVNAKRAADSAEASAATASAAAQDAVETAESVHDIAVQAQEDAETAKTNAQTAITNAAAAQTAAGAAQTSADNAQASAQSAQNSANGALNGLSTVQDVIGALEWAKKNAEFSLTTDTEIEPGKTYWTVTATAVTPAGTENPSEENWYTNIGTSTVPVYQKTTDTTVQSGTTYYDVEGTPVPNPVVTDIGTYYEISGVDEAMADFINTHLALTDEGLYVLGGANQWKVLIAPDGVYIIDGTSGVDKVVAKYKDAITLGTDDGTEYYLSLAKKSLDFLDDDGFSFFHVGANPTMVKEIIKSQYMGDPVTFPDGYTADMACRLTYSERGITADDIIEVKVTDTGEVLEPDVGYMCVGTSALFVYVRDNREGVQFTITYSAKNVNDSNKHLTLGQKSTTLDTARREPGENSMSIGTGFANGASATLVIGEGVQAKREASNSLVVGKNAVVGGSYNDGYTSQNNIVAGTDSGISHGSNSAVIGKGLIQSYYRDSSYEYHYHENQLVIGQYNKGSYLYYDEQGGYIGEPDPTNLLFIIGNGASHSSRSNALAVTFDGNIKMCLNNYQTSGNVDKTIYDALNSLGWLSDCTES